MKRKLIAFDLDGTLLTTEKALTAENEAALRRAAEAGAELVPATGRFYGAIPENVRRLPYIHYAITINGAQVLDLRTGRSICRAEIPLARALEVLRVLDGLPVIYTCYQDDWGWMSQAHYDRAGDYAPHKYSLDVLRRLHTPVPELRTHIEQKGCDVQKLQMFFLDPALRLASMRDFAARWPDLCVTTSVPRNVEINSRDAQKGVALARLAAFLDIDPADTVAFGDDMNDLSMLRAAGLGVAMENACPEAKAAADLVTASCDDSGVAKALARIYAEAEG